MLLRLLTPIDLPSRSAPLLNVSPLRPTISVVGACGCILAPGAIACTSSPWWKASRPDTVLLCAMS